MQLGLDELMDAVDKAALNNVEMKYVDRSSKEFHWTIYHDAALDALRWVLPSVAPSYIDEPTPWYLIDGANPPS